MKEKIGVYIDGFNEPDELIVGIEEWVVVRDLKGLIDLVVNYDKIYDKLPPVFSFSHDLTDEHVNLALINPRVVPKYDELKEPTGFHCLSWLMELIDVNDISVYPEIMIHSTGFTSTLIQDVANEWLKKKGAQKFAFHMKLKTKNKASKSYKPQVPTKEKKARKKKTETKPSYNLFLDDIRDPKNKEQMGHMKHKLGRDFIIYDKFDWMVVRNYDAFVDAIKRHGLPDFISFDHDLADEHYCPPAEYETYDDWVAAQNFKEKNGYEAAKWLKEYCINNNLKLPKFIVHSMNPVGTENITKLLNGPSNVQQTPTREESSLSETTTTEKKTDEDKV